MKLLKEFVLSIGVVTAFFAISDEASAKNLVYCSEASPEGFDPALYANGTAFDASAWTVYNRLVEFDPDKPGVFPGLAESWQISDDGKEYTFRLRKNVKFQKTAFFTPTRTLNADDVIFTFDRARNPDNPWHTYTSGIRYQYFESMGLNTLIKDIVKVDDQTVKFILERPDAPFLADLAMAFLSINSLEYAQQLEKQGKREQFNLQPVGTGPFSFVAYQKDALIRYKANSDYYAGKPKIDNLVFSITTDPAVRAQKLKAGECDIMSYPAPADIGELKSNPDLKVVEQPGLNIAYMAYNTTMPPFDNVDVRRALNMSVNKKAIVDAVFDGAAIVAKNPMPPTIWGYNDNVKDDAYDPEKAKQMLEAAGVKNFKMKIWAMPISRPYMPNARRAAELIQSDFKKVGVDAEIVSMEWGEYVKAGKARDRDGAIILGWTGDNGDPDNFLGVLLSCISRGTTNYAGWCSKPFDDLIEKGKTVTDQQERTRLYEQAQLIFKDQAPWLTLDHSTVFMPMRKNVTGFKLYPVSGYRFEHVDIEN